MRAISPGRGPGSGQEAGFVLPLAAAASLVLVLSSLSIQTVVLQNRSSGMAQWRQRQAVDSLTSASQQVAIQLEGPGLCLLQMGAQPCPMAQELEKLLPPSAGARVVDWKVLLGGNLAIGNHYHRGQLRLQLLNSAISRSFLVSFDPALGRVIQMRVLGS